MCQRLCLHFRINSGEAVVSFSFWFIEKTQIRGCVFHSEQDYQLKLTQDLFLQGLAPSVLRMQSQYLNAEFPSVFPHLSVPRKSLQFTYTHMGGGMSTPSSHSPPHPWSWFTDLPYCININSLPCYFLKVLGSSFERKIKVFCLKYSTLGIHPSRQYGQECTRLVFFRSAESFSIFPAGFANSRTPVLSCHTYKTKM